MKQLQFAAIKAEVATTKLWREGDKTGQTNNQDSIRGTIIGNIARGETSQAITSFHFFDYFNYFGFHHKITVIT